MLPVTSIAATVLGAMFIILSVRVVERRRSERIAVGTGSESLARAIRAHGNFAESVPLVLILLALAELNRAPAAWLAAVAATFVVGRIAHAFSLVRGELDRTGPNPTRFRVIGTALTFAVIALLAATIVLALAVDAVT